MAEAYVPQIPKKKYLQTAMLRALTLDAPSNYPQTATRAPPCVKPKTPMKTLVKIAAMLDPPAYSEAGPTTLPELRRWQAAITKAREFVEALKDLPPHLYENVPYDMYEPDYREQFNTVLDAIIRGE